jgi:hypothetical protein
MEGFEEECPAIEGFDAERPESGDTDEDIREDLIFG